MKDIMGDSDILHHYSMVIVRNKVKWDVGLGDGSSSLMYHGGDREMEIIDVDNEPDIMGTSTVTSDVKIAKLNGIFDFVIGPLQRKGALPSLSLFLPTSPYIIRWYFIEVWTTCR